MNRISKYCSLIGFAAIFALSNAAYAACSFTPADEPGFPSDSFAPDGVSDLSGQGNFNCTDFIGSGGDPMTEVTEVNFINKDGDWELPMDDWMTDGNGFVKNTPDKIVLFPQGQGSRCSFSYFRENAVKGTGLSIGGNVSKNNSIACTDGIVNSEEVPPPPEPDIVITGDSCVVQLDATIRDEEGNPVPITETAFDVFTSTNLDGTRQAICSADGTAQNECVRGCPDFLDVHALQYPETGIGVCLPDATGKVPLYDGTQRCTPCLTQAQAEAAFPDFDTGFAEDGTTELKLCWEWVNSVDVTGEIGGILQGTYKPHKAIRSQTTETDLFNACYQTTVTVNFFGREIVKTVTTCD